MWIIWLPVGDKDDGVCGLGGLYDDMVDVQKGLREAKTVAERPSSLLVSVLRLQTLNNQIVACLFGEGCQLTKNPAGGREAVEEFLANESSNVARRQVSITELFAAEGHNGSSCRR